MGHRRNHGGGRVWRTESPLYLGNLRAVAKRRVQGTAKDERNGTRWNRRRRSQHGCLRR
nr:MAG TPA: hypothetical protein [Caudoviricetes sp.]